MHGHFRIGFGNCPRNRMSSEDMIGSGSLWFWKEAKRTQTDSQHLFYVSLDHHNLQSSSWDVTPSSFLLFSISGKKKKERKNTHTHTHTTYIKISVKSLIVINMPTRELLAGEKELFCVMIWTFKYRRYSQENRPREKNSLAAKSAPSPRNQFRVANFFLASKRRRDYL